jgi:hypothetical protein
MTWLFGTRFGSKLLKTNLLIQNKTMKKPVIIGKTDQFVRIAVFSIKSAKTAWIGKKGKIGLDASENQVHF